MSTGHMPSWKSKRSMDSFVSSGTPWTWVRIDMQLKSRNSGDSKCRHNESEGPRDVHENKSVLQGRIGHTAVCSSASDTCFYVWGGVRETARGSQYMDDLHRFDTRTRCWEWIRTRGDRPCARAFHTTIMYQGNMYIFGGCNGKGRFNRVFCINPQTGVSNLLATSGDTPATRYCHTGVLYRHLMIVFGGKCGGRNSNKRLADMFSFNLCENIWTAVDQLGDVPNSRSAHVSVVCGHKMLMFGGRNAAGDCCPELFEFDLQTNMWCRIFSSEPLFTRARHSAVVHNECLIVFGGWNGRKKMNDLFVLRLVNRTFELIVENNEWATCAPCRRECHTAVVCNHQMYICCGRFRDTFLNDVYALSLPGKTLKEVVRDHILNDKVSLNFNRFGISQSLVNYLAEYSNSGLLDIPSTSTQAQFVALARAPSDTHSALIKEIDNLCCSPQSISNRIFSNSQVHSRNSAVHSDGDHDVELCEELNQDDERSSSVD